MKSIVSVTWLSENLNSSELIILDASLESNAENLVVPFPGIQIKGARYFDLKGVFSDADNDLPNMLPDPEIFASECRKLGINSSSKIVVYDNLGIYSSPRVWWMFKIMGHETIAVLDGGLPEWKNKGLSCGPIKHEGFDSGNFKSIFQKELVRNTSQLIDNIKSESEIIIDARSKERFEGTVPEAREHLKSGHIPKSLSLPFLELLKDGKLLPKKDLIIILGELKLNDKPLVFTCGSGITACILLLASDQIGYPVKNSIYDGSWVEWGQLNDCLIEN